MANPKRWNHETQQWERLRVKTKAELAVEDAREEVWRAMEECTEHGITVRTVEGSRVLLALDFHISAETDNHTMVACISTLAGKLDDLHRATGGSGLTLEQGQHWPPGPSAGSFTV